MLLVGLLPLLWASCPVISCLSLETGVCAYKNSARALFVSTQRCPVGLTCQTSSIYPYWWSNAPLGSPLYCESLASVPEAVNSTFVSQSCLRFESGKELKRGVEVECAEDQDCEMMDGTHIVGGCRCGFRGSGLGLCQPHPSSSVFEGYWTACERGNGVVHSREEFEYWSFYMTYYVYLNSDVSCSRNLLESTQLLSLTIALQSLSSSALLCSLLFFSST